jgi:uncharacterized protein YndB with AHSA1/START domain
MTEDTTLRIERIFDAPPAEVFRVWTDPSAMEEWYRDQPDHEVNVAHLDVRVGGSYRIEWGAVGVAPHVEHGTYLEVEPGRRLVMTEHLEGVDAPWADTRVTVELHDHERGTRLVLTHEGFPSQRHRDLATGGWPGFLDRIAVLIGQRRAPATPAH